MSAAWICLCHVMLSQNSRNTNPHRTYDNGSPGIQLDDISLMILTNCIIVNDVCIHPNQGELISCDQAGSIKQWDLSDNTCSHELVGDRLPYWL